MHLRIEPNSGIPLGAQIVRQIRLAIASGRLSAGERLPSARELAADIRVNFHTVRKAFGELEAEGLVVSTRGRGTFVAEELPALARREIRESVREHLERLFEDLAGSGITAAELGEIVKAELEELGRKSKQRS